MRYFYDCEFIEDGKTIDLISIGVVAEDGREFYMCSLDFDEDKASDWVRENVFPHLPERPPHLGVEMYPGYLKSLGSAAYAFPFPEPWGSRGTIATALRRFVGDDRPEFWGYYSAYDHVALCQLFGTMMDLPEGWPRYTRDLKQLCDSLGSPRLPEQGKGKHDALADARWNRGAYTFLQSYAAPDSFDAVTAARELFDALGVQPTLRQMRLAAAALHKIDSSAERRGAEAERRRCLAVFQNHSCMRAGCEDEESHIGSLYEATRARGGEPGGGGERAL